MIIRPTDRGIVIEDGYSITIYLLKAHSKKSDLRTDNWRDHITVIPNETYKKYPLSKDAPEYIRDQILDKAWNI